VWNAPTYESNEVQYDPNYVEAEPLDDRIPLEVKVRNADEWIGPPTKKVIYLMSTANYRKWQAYPMCRNPRGMALIIDNETFVNDILPKREGSRMDSNNLEDLFTQLGFKVRNHFH